MSMPKGWEEVRLGDIGEFLKTYSNSRADLQENDEIFYIHYGDIHTTYDYFLDFATHNPPMINSSKLKSNDLVLLQDGDLVIADASEDYEGIAKSAEVINIGQKRAVAGLHTFLFRADDKYLAKKFRAYFLCSDFVRQQFKKIATGISVLGISKTNIQNIKIKLPPLKEQEKIAEILSSCDEHIKNLKNLKSELEKEKLHLMNELLSGKTRFSSFTTPWQEVKLAEICNISSGGTPSKKVAEYWENGTIKWLGSTVCKNEKYINEITDYITESGLKNSSAKLYKSGTTLMALVGATIGKVAYLDFEATTNQNIAGLYPKDKNKVDCEFLFYSALMLYGYIFSQSNGNFNMANLTFVRDLKIKLPSLEEQKKIGEVLSACDERLECLNELITAETTLKSHLLTELLTGNIRV